MRNKQNHLNASARRLRIGLAVAASALAVCVLPATALGSVLDTTQFSVNPGSLAFGSSSTDTPNLNAVTLNGQAQTTNTQMTNFSVADATGSGSGYNVTVAGDGPSGSAVFKQFCTVANCGSDPAGYVSGGKTLVANSLTLNSTSAGFTAQNGSTGTAPTHSCNSGCFMDSASPVKVISAATSAGMGTFVTSGYTASSLSLATPSNTSVLPANEVYKVNLVWSLNSGP
ncbi:MAG: WxL domain-containing protein [Chloroflexota bacterium]|nr:WxL domain-containing protein [Chloroflexota bacterium]